MGAKTSGRWEQIVNPCVGMLFINKDREDSRIEAIGWDWFVGRDEIGEPRFYRFDSNIEMLVWLGEHRR